MVNIYHETSLFKAQKIFDERRILSLTPPHPAEFLLSIGHL